MKPRMSEERSSAEREATSASEEPSSKTTREAVAPRGPRHSSAGDPDRLAAPPPSFQSIVARLMAFWAERDCVVLPPLDVEVGATTMAPQTFFRALGRRPWRGAQLQSVRRPWDGRYGHNPLRLARHSQLGVLLKPPDGQAFAIYLESLSSIGLLLERHDLQLREAEWRVEVLGIEGQGWRVRLDGVPVTHFTYLQRVGGRAVEAVSLEINYGVERLALVAQGAQSIDSLSWGDRLTYADVRRFQEEDLSAYYNEVASIDRLEAAFESSREEAVGCLDRALVLPAYEAVLRCSHLFQVLRRRGAIDSAHEPELRTVLRSLAGRCADLWLERSALEEQP